MPSPIEIVKTAYDGFAEGDIPRAVSVMHPHVEWLELFPFAGDYHGVEEIQRLLQRVTDAYESYEMQVTDWIDGGEVVVVLGDYRCRRKGDADAFESRFCHVFWVEDGKIVKYEQITDTGMARTSNA
jgi:ketosteroid isomerase-like protein